MKLKSKLLSVALSAMVAVTMCAPVTAFAADESTWAAPTEAKTVDDSIVKVGIHAAASTTAFFLGGNVVAERATDYSSIANAATAQDKYEAAMKFTRLGAFGSSSNINPDPYLWNYFYNLAVDAGQATGERVADEVFISDGATSPMSSDVKVQDAYGTSYTLARLPEVLMDKAGGYADLIAQMNAANPELNYDPISIDYKANNFADLVDDMYNLADAIKLSGKGTRYEDPSDIAQNYEAYMKGIQLYIASKIADGTVAKKKVAVVDTVNGADTDNDGAVDTFQLVDNTVNIGTSTDRPSESIMYISDNMFSDATVAKSEYEVTTTSRGQTTTSKVQGASAKDIAAYADVIIQAGHTSQTEAQIREAFKAAGAELSADTPVYAVDPSDVFTIRANSVENFAGVAIFGGFLYPEIVDPVDATMYIYEAFWHLDPSALATFAQANFANASLPVGADASGAKYNSDEIEGMINAGIEYYKANASTYAGTTLEFSDRFVEFKGLPQAAPVEPTVKPTVKAKKTNTLTVKTTNKTYKVKTLKKAKQTYTALKVSKAKGTVTYKATYTNAKSKKALKFSKGKVTVKKGTKKGTYKVKVKVTAKGNSSYKSKSVTKTITVKVK